MADGLATAVANAALGTITGTDANYISLAIGDPVQLAPATRPV